MSAATIWKEPLHWEYQEEGYGLATIEVPEDADFLHAEDQGDQTCVWFYCDPEAPKVQRHLAIIGTGGEVPTRNGWKPRHLTTFQRGGGPLGGIFVFHVFVL